MKLKWNKTVSSTIMAVLILAVVPILYIVLFTAGIVNQANKNKPIEVTGYATQASCEKSTAKNCEQVTTESKDTFWIEAGK